MNILDYLTKQRSSIEQHLDLLIPQDNVPYKQLFQAARYFLLGSGKRLRPILALATAEIFGAKTPNILTAACTLEMVHSYSLIHDDLPCMDDDDFRRGKPSLHKQYNEGLAVLTGDFLLTHAFEVLANDSSLSAEQKVNLIRILSQASGGHGMIAGQVLDVEAENAQVTLEHLSFIHAKKTGALITAAVEFGGVLAQVSEHLLQPLRAFGRDLGLAFQIADDILDVTASQEKHGKAIGSDIINKKTTYTSLLGLEQARKNVQSLYISSLEALKQLPYDTSLLVQFANNLLEPAQI
jgi:geranylgeranyl pyrophosphate synthase